MLDKGTFKLLKFSCSSKFLSTNFIIVYQNNAATDLEVAFVCNSRLLKLLKKLIESIPQNADQPHGADYAMAQDVTPTVGHDHAPTQVAVSTDQ